MDLDLLFKIAGVWDTCFCFSHSLKTGRQRRYGSLMYFSRLCRAVLFWVVTDIRQIIYKCPGSIQAILKQPVEVQKQMDIISIIGLGFVVTLLILIIKQQRSAMAVQLSIVLSVTIFLLILDKIGIILDLFYDLAVKANINQVYLNTILKIIGIVYITEFGSQICRAGYRKKVL